MVSANWRRGESVQAARAVSRGERFDRGNRSSARRHRRRVERNRRRTNDFARPRIGQSNVKKEGLSGPGIAEREVDQDRRRSTAAPDLRPDLDALLSHRAGELDALLILFLDDDAVAVELRG